MDCIKNDKQGVEILTDYCAGAANPEVAAEISAHILTCAECKALVDAQRKVWEMLDAWAPAEVSPDFDSRLYARIAQEQTGPAWRRWWSRLTQPATPYAWWKPAVSMAVAGAIVSFALITRLPERTAPVQPTASIAHLTAGTPQAGADQVDLQQVEQALDDLDVVAPANQVPSAPGSSQAPSRL